MKTITFDTWGSDSAGSVYRIGQLYIRARSAQDAAVRAFVAGNRDRTPPVQLGHSVDVGRKGYDQWENTEASDHPMLVRYLSRAIRKVGMNTEKKQKVRSDAAALLEAMRAQGLID